MLIKNMQRQKKKKKKDRSKASNSSVLGPFLSKIAPGMVDKGGAARNKKEERERKREKQKAANPFVEIEHKQPRTRGEMKKVKGYVNRYKHLSTV